MEIVPTSRNCKIAFFFKAWKYHRNVKFSSYAGEEVDDMTQSFYHDMSDFISQ